MADIGKLIAPADYGTYAAQGYPNKSQEKLGKEQPGDDGTATDPSIGGIIGEMVGYLLRQRVEKSNRQYRRKDQKPQRQNDIRPPECPAPVFLRDSSWLGLVDGNPPGSLCFIGISII